MDDNFCLLVNLVIFQSFCTCLQTSHWKYSYFYKVIRINEDSQCGLLCTCEDNYCKIKGGDGQIIDLVAIFEIF
ncbi:hypothetical protein SS50377_24990 [Spironucleus salmonicida]|uniref:Cysteine-rich protein n=1 Tax=Spironucleus salmonicida TaxID=348837 RepID=V6M6R3_9EUKA|nr:hypothetical protein SS50377_24990 [Spironucleus salmonicida]|eukprot:EST49109.1 Hypothetical protein SS50377_10592 [Spironucleus salmonicida]